MIDSSVQSNINLLQDELFCPIYLVPLSKAVAFVPCAHKVQQVAAEELCGPTYDGWQVKSKVPCPVCRSPVFGWIIDRSTRNIVRQLFELPANELNLILATMKKNLAEKCLSVEKDVRAKVPYPGKPGKFVHDGGDWSSSLPWYPGAILCRSMRCRSMRFVSINEDSFIKEFSINGFLDGSVDIQILFPEDSDKAEKYLKQFNVVLGASQKACGHKSSINHEQLISMFNIIAENNEIPSSHFEMIKEIVSKGTC